MIVKSYYEKSHLKGRSDVALRFCLVNYSMQEGADIDDGVQVTTVYEGTSFAIRLNLV